MGLSRAAVLLRLAGSGAGVRPQDSLTRHVQGQEPDWLTFRSAASGALVNGRHPAQRQSREDERPGGPRRSTFF
jgi:hypothetical protein